MQIDREITKDIVKKLAVPNAKIIVIYGARQVGKTTLADKIIKQTGYKTLYLNGDDAMDAKRIIGRNTEKLASLIAGYELLFIDEAQKIEDIGTNLKILHDQFKTLKIVVTGSSSLELANNIKEPLTGRFHKYLLYPISFLELSKHFTHIELERKLENFLTYGSYPDVLNIESEQDKKEYLTNLTQSYLYRDVLELENVKYSQKIRDLLELLALQIGCEISYHELGQKLGMSNHTVINYIDLLEKSFVVQTVRGFSRNLRKEITKKPKVYFYDLGVRNALIGNFSDINKRNDLGGIWENFLFIERVKRNHYLKHICSNYFWRTYTGAELDYLEEYDGQLFGYEFKWSKDVKAPKLWIEQYGNNYQCINKNNFLDFIL